MVGALWNSRWHSSVNHRYRSSPVDIASLGRAQSKPDQDRYDVAYMLNDFLIGPVA
jgi:hypothetical protein